MWPQYWGLQGPRGLEQRDLRNLNLGDLNKGPNGGLSPTQQKKQNYFVWLGRPMFLLEIIYVRGICTKCKGNLLTAVYSRVHHGP
jgi:hypothetical protein